MKNLNLNLRFKDFYIFIISNWHRYHLNSNASLCFKTSLSYINVRSSNMDFRTLTVNNKQLFSWYYLSYIRSLYAKTSWPIAGWVLKLIEKSFSQMRPISRWMGVWTNKILGLRASSDHISMRTSLTNINDIDKYYWRKSMISIFIIIITFKDYK